MEIILKYACSLDGFLDDTNSQPFIFSGEEDQAAVDKLRASADAILVGAETLRQDNPALKIKSTENITSRKLQGLSDQPIRLCLSKQGNLSTDLQFFDQSSPSYLISETTPPELKDYHLKLKNGCELTQVIQLIKELGVNKLLVEGGWQLHQQFLASSFNFKLRISVAPIFLAETGRTRVQLKQYCNLRLAKQRRLGDNTILWLEK